MDRKLILKLLGMLVGFFTILIFLIRHLWVDSFHNIMASLFNSIYCRYLELILLDLTKQIMESSTTFWNSWANKVGLAYSLSVRINTYWCLRMYSKSPSESPSAFDKQWLCVKGNAQIQLWLLTRSRHICIIYHVWLKPGNDTTWIPLKKHHYFCWAGDAQKAYHSNSLVNNVRLMCSLSIIIATDQHLSLHTR